MWQPSIISLQLAGAVSVGAVSCCYPEHDVFFFVMCWGQLNRKLAGIIKGSPWQSEALNYGDFVWSHFRQKSEGWGFDDRFPNLLIKRTFVYFLTLFLSLFIILLKKNKTQTIKHGGQLAVFHCTPFSSASPLKHVAGCGPKGYLLYPKPHLTVMSQCTNTTCITKQGGKKRRCSVAL